MPENTPNLNSLFDAAARIESADQRAVYLDKACGDNLELRKQVDQLLQSDQQVGSFLEKPVSGLDETIAPTAAGSALAGSYQEVTGMDLAASRDAESDVEFSINDGGITIDSSRSVLRSLGNTLAEVPQVSLPKSAAQGDDPIAMLSSPEMPRHDSDSRYRLDGEIARGGMGAIIKGRDTDLGRDLAIKVLLDSHKDKPEVIQRFVEEAQISGQLQHPGIAPIYELGQFKDKRPFFAMKLVKGQTLSKLLADREDASDLRGKFIGIFEQICQTMGYAHSRGVIHRDLKPANIMVGAFGEVQVMDWGLAKVLQVGGVADEKRSKMLQQGTSIIRTLRSGDGNAGSGLPDFGSSSVGSQTQMGSVMGTPAYMPPEQALGEIDNMDERADVFGLGAILCEILTGKPPYVAKTGLEVHRMASRGKLADAFARLNECGADTELISLTKECLELEPVDRPRDSGVLAQRVTEYLESVQEKLREAEVQRAAEAARAEAESARATAEIKRRRTSLALAASVLLLVALGSGGWLYMERQEANRQTAKADAQRIHATQMETIAEQRDVQRKTAERAQATALTAQERAERETERAQAAEIRADKQAQRANEAAELAEARLARSDYFVALTKFRDNDVSRGSELLENIPERYRNFEWHYDYNHFRQSRLSFQVRKGHAERIRLRRDGKLFSVIGGNDLHLFDAETGAKVEFEISSETDKYDACWSSDGKIFSVLRRHQIDLYDAITLEFNKSLPIRAHVGDEMVLALDGESFYNYNASVLCNSSYATGKRLWTVNKPDHGLRSMALSNDGSQLAVGRWVGVNDGLVYIHDTTSGELIQEFKTRLPVAWLAFSPDDSMLAFPKKGYSSVNVGLINPSSGEILKTIETGNHRVAAVAFSPDGTRLLTGGLDTRVNLWDLATGEKLESFSEHRSPINGLCWLNDGAGFISSDKAGYVHITDFESNEDDEILQKGKQAMAVCIRDFDGLIATGNGGKVIIRDADEEVLRSFSVKDKLAVKALSFSPDGRLLAVADSAGLIALRDPDSGELVRELKKHSRMALSLAFSPDGTKLVSGGLDRQVFVWDLTTGKPIWSLEGHKAGIYAVAFSPDGKMIVTSSRERALYFWDAKTGQRIQSAQFKEADSEVPLEHRFKDFTFSPDGRYIVAGTEEGEIVYFNRETGLEEARFISNARSIDEIIFSPDGSRLAIGSNDQTVRILDPKTHEELRVLTGHTSNVESICFNPVGSKLYSASFDGTVRVWDATPSQR